MTTHTTHTSGTTGTHSSSTGTTGAALSPLDERKQVAQNEASSQKSDPKATFLGDAIAAANLYPHDGSQAHTDNNPGLLTKDWDPSSAGLPKDSGVLIYPDIDSGIKALHTFIGKILSNPPSTPPPATPPSPPFTPDMTIVLFARSYAASRPDDWVTKFCDYAGVTPDQKLSDVAA